MFLAEGRVHFWLNHFRLILKPPMCPQTPALPAYTRMHTHAHSRLCHLWRADRKEVHQCFEKAPEVVLLLYSSKLKIIKKKKILMNQINLQKLFFFFLVFTLI